MVPSIVVAALLALISAGPINAIKFVVIGDWGVDNQNQAAVARAMSSWCSPSQWGPCEFILNTGDNFYPDGVDLPDHPRFNTTWRWMYNLPNIDQLVWYQSVGNHDYGIIDSRELNQVEYSKTDPQWYLPWLWYDFFKISPDDDAVVHFIVVDTMSFILRKHDSERQLVWLEETLQRSPADWKILIGHSPPYSAGNHAPGTITMREILVPICNKYGIDVFLNGDEHNMEHITSSNVTDYVISGAGGRGLYEFSPAGERVLNGWGLTVDYFGYHFGFLGMEMKKTTMTVEFVDTETNVRYSFSRNKSTG